MNKEAALVTGKGIHYNPPTPKVPQFCYSTQPEMWTFGHRFNKAYPDFRGKRFGRFTAIGVSVEFPGKWVMKCSCGKYEFRRAKALKNYKETSCNEMKMCQFCQQNEVFAVRSGRYMTWIENGAKKREEEGQ